MDSRVCECQTAWARASFRRGVCPDCRAAQRVRELLHGTEYKAIFGGDPRGFTLKLAPLDATERDIDRGTAQGVIGVPSKE